MLFWVLLSSTPSNADSLAWDANSEPDLDGYKVYRGYLPGDYDYIEDVGNITTYPLTGLALDQEYYFAVTAYDNEDPVNESGFSNEVLWFESSVTYVGALILAASKFNIPSVQGDYLQMGEGYEATQLPNGRWLIIYDQLDAGDNVRLEY